MLLILLLVFLLLVKVLLIGCDLRNPQLHKYINYDKNVPGLVDYLVDNKTEWKKYNKSF